MDLTEAITIFIPSILALAVIDGLAMVAPFKQAIVDDVLIGADQRASLDDVGDG